MYTEILTDYILPSLLLFGTLYAVGKGIEYLAWQFIENHDEFLAWAQAKLGAKQ